MSFEHQDANQDAAEAVHRTEPRPELRPELRPVCPGGCVLVYALSGLGKSTLAATWPERILDGDQFLYAAVAQAWPGLERRARLRAWRALCAQRPWLDGGDALDRWAAVRRAFTQPLTAALQAGRYPLVLTSLLDPPWAVSAYYGVTRGRYLEHLRRVGRLADNRQSEAMNDRLEGYHPLRRLSPGSYLGQQPELQALLR